MTNDEWTFATGQDWATGVAVLHNVITGIYIILCHGIDNYDSESIYRLVLSGWQTILRIFFCYSIADPSWSIRNNK
jgi:hypothetical protein